MHLALRGFLYSHELAFRPNFFQKGMSTQNRDTKPLCLRKNGGGSCARRGRPHTHTHPGHAHTTRHTRHPGFMAALLDAVTRDQIEEVTRLLDNGTDVNHADGEGLSAVIIASKLGSSSCVTLLLTRNADPNATTREGRSALMFASKYGHTAVAELLIDHGATVGVADTDGWTALMRAGEDNRCGVAKLLLSRNADVNASDKEGSTSLMYASALGHTEMVTLLLDHGADANVVNDDLRTALMLADMNGRTAVHGVIDGRIQEAKAKQRAEHLASAGLGLSTTSPRAANAGEQQGLSMAARIAARRQESSRLRTSPDKGSLPALVAAPSPAPA